MAKNIDIGGRLHSVATDHIVTGSDEIQDDTLNKTQAKINEEVNSTLEIHSSAIEGLNSQNYESYAATNGTTAITDVLPDLGAVNTIYRLGNWDGTQYDTTQYAEYAWITTGIDQGEYVLLDVKNYGIDDEPTAESENLVKSGGVEKQTNRLLSFTLGWSALHIYDGELTYNGWVLGQGTHRQIKVQKGDEISVKGNAVNGSYLGVLKTGGQPISSTVNYATGESRRDVLTNSIINFTVTADDAQYLVVEIERPEGNTTPQYLYINGVNVLENTIEKAYDFYPRIASIAGYGNFKINITLEEITIPAYLRIIYGKGKVYRLTTNVTLTRDGNSNTQSEYVIFNSIDKTFALVNEAYISANNFPDGSYILFCVTQALTGCSLPASMYNINGKSQFTDTDDVEEIIKLKALPIDFFNFEHGYINYDGTKKEDNEWFRTVKIKCGYGDTIKWLAGYSQRDYYISICIFDNNDNLLIYSSIGDNPNVNRTLTLNQEGQENASYIIASFYAEGNGYLDINDERVITFSDYRNSLSTMPNFAYKSDINDIEEEIQLSNDDVHGYQRTTYQAALYWNKFSYGVGTYCLIPVKQGDVVTTRCGNNPCYYVVLRDKQIVTSGTPSYHYATGENDRHTNGGSYPVQSTYTITASNAAYIALEVSRVENNVTIDSLPEIITINGKSVLGLEHNIQNLLECPATRYASIASTTNARINITDTEIVIPAYLRIVYGEGNVYRLLSAVTLQRVAGTGTATQSEYVLFNASDHSIKTVKEDAITVDTFTSKTYILFNVSNGLSGCSLSFSQYTINGSPAVESNKYNATDIVTQNKHKESALIATLLNKGNNVIKSDNKVSLLFFTDLHGNAANLTRIVKFGTHYATYIDDMIHGGDSVSTTIQDANPFESVVGAQNILNVAGNHEAWLTTTDTDYLATEKQVYDKIFAPSISNWNVVQPENAAANGQCYYYKDYRNMRLIVLDDVHWHKGGNQQIVDDYTAQKTWFEGILADAITNNKVVVCAMHYPPRYIVPLENVKGFNRYGTTESTDITDGWYADDVIFDCVDTFINNGGTFMGWMIGHTHEDYIGYVKNHANQPIVITGTAGSASRDNKNVVGTNSRDNFNIITFSWVNNNTKLIKIMRVGNDMDMYGRSKKSISFNIVDGSILEVE